MESDLGLLEPVMEHWEESPPVAITDQLEGMTVIAKAKAKRYDSSVSGAPFF